MKVGDRVYVKRCDWSEGMLGVIHSIDIFVNVILDNPQNTKEPGFYFPTVNAFKPEHVRLSKLGQVLE